MKGNVSIAVTIGSGARVCYREPLCFISKVIVFYRRQTGMDLPQLLRKGVKKLLSTYIGDRQNGHNRLAILQLEAIVRLRFLPILKLEIKFSNLQSLVNIKKLVPYL